MTLIKLRGRGWLVPTRLPGVAYQVRYGIQQVRQRDRYFGRFSRRTHPTRCSFRSLMRGQSRTETVGSEEARLRARLRPPPKLPVHISCDPRLLRM